MAKKKSHKQLEVEGALAVFNEPMVSAAFALADETVTTREQAAAVFGEVIEALRDWVEVMTIPSFDDGNIHFVNTTDPRDVPTFDTADWATGQSLMRKWLPDLARFDKLSAVKSARLLREISETAESLGHSMRMRLGRHGLLEWAIERDTIANACCRAAMPFIMPNGWSPRRIGQCQFEKCGRWFLRPEPRRGSVPLYCSKKHATNARMSALRQRQRQEANQ